jgi:hypothetical protein
MAAKMRKKHKNKISGLVISMCYNEQKIENLTFYESIRVITMRTYSNAEFFDFFYNSQQTTNNMNEPNSLG